MNTNKCRGKAHAAAPQPINESRQHEMVALAEILCEIFCSKHDHQKPYQMRSLTASKTRP